VRETEFSTREGHRKPEDIRLAFARQAVCVVGPLPPTVHGMENREPIIRRFLNTTSVNIIVGIEAEMGGRLHVRILANGHEGFWRALSRLCLGRALVTVEWRSAQHGVKIEPLMRTTNFFSSGLKIARR